MAIHATSSKLHWNYFLALEHDLDVLSRYVEFCPANLSVFSLELAHLLFAAASEVDVLAKCLCQIFAPASPRENITHYRPILLAQLTALPTTEISVPRYGLKFCPWDNWATAAGPNPNWWKSYNNVKHERNVFFQEATLQNALNALGALLILNFHFYRFTLSPPGPHPPRSTTRELQPESKLLRLPEDHYDSYLLV